jgi:hypothetical protein
MFRDLHRFTLLALLSPDYPPPIFSSRSGLTESGEISAVLAEPFTAPDLDAGSLGQVAGVVVSFDCI